MKNTINLSLLIVIALFIFACTNPRRLQDAQDENLRLQQENEAMTKKVNEVDSAMQEMSDQLATFKKQIEGLRLDTT
ncbi:MAG: hypothetical protein IIA45_01545, partial [Bacteroidetes bacterium]|nr:hypothetical protein [Bacteroidota bacterium]